MKWINSSTQLTQSICSSLWFVPPLFVFFRVHPTGRLWNVLPANRENDCWEFWNWPFDAFAQVHTPAQGNIGVRLIDHSSRNPRFYSIFFYELIRLIDSWKTCHAFSFGPFWCNAWLRFYRSPQRYPTGNMWVWMRMRILLAGDEILIVIFKSVFRSLSLSVGVLVEQIAFCVVGQIIINKVRKSIISQIQKKPNTSSNFKFVSPKMSAQAFTWAIGIAIWRIAKWQKLCRSSSVTRTCKMS